MQQELVMSCRLPALTKRYGQTLDPSRHQMYQCHALEIMMSMPAVGLWSVARRPRPDLWTIWLVDWTVPGPIYALQSRAPPEASCNF